MRQGRDRVLHPAVPQEWWPCLQAYINLRLHQLGQDHRVRSDEHLPFLPPAAGPGRVNTPDAGPGRDPGA